MTIVMHDQAYPDPMTRIRKWRATATKLGIEVVEDVDQAEARKQAELAKVNEEFLSGL